MRTRSMLALARTSLAIVLCAACREPQEPRAIPAVAADASSDASGPLDAGAPDAFAAVTGIRGGMTWSPSGAYVAYSTDAGRVVASTHDWHIVWVHEGLGDFEWMGENLCYTHFDDNHATTRIVELPSGVDRPRTLPCGLEPVPPIASVVLSEQPNPKDTIYSSTLVEIALAFTDGRTVTRQASVELSPRIAGGPFHIRPIGFASNGLALELRAYGVSDLTRRVVTLDPAAPARFNVVPTTLGPGGAAAFVSIGGKTRLVLVQGAGAPPEIVDPATGRIERTFQFPGAAKKKNDAMDPIADDTVCLGATADHLVTASFDDDLRVYELATGRLVFRQASDALGVNRDARWRDCEITVAGTRAAYWGRKGFAVIVDLAARRIVRTIDRTNDVSGRRDVAIGNMVWDSQGTLAHDLRSFAVQRADERVEIVDVETGAVASVDPGAGGLAFSPDGRLLVSGSKIYRLTDRARVATLP